MKKGEVPLQTDKQKMLAGELYRGSDPELVAERARCEGVLRELNAAEMKARPAILARLFGKVGPNPMVNPVFFCDYGANIRAGRNLFVNYNCVFLDCAAIGIGDDVQIAPAVQIYTALHPLDPEERRSGLESARPVRIGSNVWIGGAAIICPGVTIGDHAVIGAGSVVTKDVAPGSLVAGNPARELRSRL
jgi:maltose O-acetyltransferase